MRHSRLHILIKKLTKKEKTKLKQFLASPFFNKRADLQQLFLLLEKGKIIEKQAAFAKIYPNTPYNDAKMRLCMSLLFQQIEQFLLVNDYLSENNDTQRANRLINIYVEKDLPKHTETAVKNAKIHLENMPLRNADFFNKKQELAYEIFQNNNNQTAETDRQLNEISSALDVGFILKKLKLASVKITLQSVYGVASEIHFLEECLAHIQQHDLLKEPAIAVYFHCFQFLKNPNEVTHFEQFKTLFFKHYPRFSASEISDLLIASINFCIKQYHSGHRNFLESHLELYQFGFKNEIFLVNGELSRYTYQNAVTFGLILKAYDWVRDILENYKNYLPKQFKISTYSFNAARLYYEQNDKNEALTLLQKADSRDVLLSLAAKMLQLQIYYELEEFDLLHSHINATRTYIRRKKIMGYHHEVYSNSLKFAQKLVDLNPYDKNERQQLKADILATKVLAEREWLLKQVEAG